VLVQAGSSPSGLAFAAKHAECVFMISGPPEVSAKRVTAVRELAAKAGRDLDDLLFVEGMTIVVGSTEEEAQRKKAEYDEWVDTVGVQAFIGGSTGLDLSTYDPDQPAADLLETAPGLRSAVQLIIDTTPGRTAKVSDFLRYSLDSWTLVGTPETIADRMEEYQAIGVDGVNVMSSLVPGTYVDFVNYVAPELRRRGLMQSEYGPGTLREKLFPGHEPRLPNSHPAAAFRHAH
jgi:alkanesulfonate monooxygenase SsuD/methylene tetrahydromethanopterin reductase-like flavin-dependent oxidoreductase (luciferase family)